MSLSSLTKQQSLISCECVRDVGCRLVTARRIAWIGLHPVVIDLCQVEVSADGRWLHFGRVAVVRGVFSKPAILNIGHLGL